MRCPNYKGNFCMYGKCPKDYPEYGCEPCSCQECSHYKDCEDCYYNDKPNYCTESDKKKYKGNGDCRQTYQTNESCKKDKKSKRKFFTK